jgi:probable addiction module antidote protein
MNSVFIGGSRHISRLPVEAKERLKSIMEKKLLILIGDAKGADTAVQKYLHENSYESVIVYCSGMECRNNVGNWRARNFEVAKDETGYQYYAFKDREMAQEAEFGFMIWDGKSPGTVLNVLRLVNASKKAVLLDVNKKQTIYFKTRADWTAFIGRSDESLVKDLRKRATDEEWVESTSSLQTSLFDKPSVDSSAAMLDEQTRQAIDDALGMADSGYFVEALGSFARAHGMTELSRKCGVARESLYRSLGSGGNPEFDTVLKVLKAMGLRLTIRPRSSLRGDHRPSVAGTLKK